MNNRLTPAKRKAMELFHHWRTGLGMPLKVDIDTAIILTKGTVDLSGYQDTINLSTLAVKYAIVLTRKAK